MRKWRVMNLRRLFNLAKSIAEIRGYPVWLGIRGDKVNEDGLRRIQVQTPENGDHIYLDFNSGYDCDFERLEVLVELGVDPDSNSWVITWPDIDTLKKEAATFTSIVAELEKEPK